MDYKDFSGKCYNLYLIKTKKFKTVSMMINFRRKAKKNEVTVRNVLSDMLVRSCNKFKSEREMVIRSEELYDMSFNSNIFFNGTYSCISVGMTTLDDKYSEENNVRDSILFLMDMIFDPYVSNKSFNGDVLSVSKNLVKQYIDGISDNPKRYAKMRAREIMAPNSPVSYRFDGYIEDLDKIDGTNLYKYYQSVLKNDVIDIFIIGDVDVSVKDVLDKFFVTERNNSFDDGYCFYKKFRTKSKKVVEKKDVNQSSLVVGYKVDKLTVFERQYVAFVYSYILGGGPDSKLFTDVREKNSLCYGINSSVEAITSSMFINAGIDYKKYRKAIKCIKNDVSSMARGEFSDDEIKRAIATFKSSCKELTDSNISIMNAYLSTKYVGYDNIDERIKNIDKVSRDDIVNFACKVHEDTIYLLEGVNDEKS